MNADSSLAPEEPIETPSARVAVRRLRSGERVVATALFELMARVFDEEHAPLRAPYVDELLARDDLWILAAFEGETVLGGLTAHVLPMTRSETRELFIYDLAVDERVQRRGVGRALIAELRRLGAIADIETAFVPAEDEDTHALAFYRAVGGTPSAVTFFTFP